MRDRRAILSIGRGAGRGAEKAEGVTVGMKEEEGGRMEEDEEEGGRRWGSEALRGRLLAGESIGEGDEEVDILVLGKGVR